MSEDVVCVGAGGHAKVCVELLRANQVNVAYCISSDDGPNELLGIPVLHGDHHLDQLWADGFRRAFVAIGNNAARDRIAADAGARGFELVNAISPAATVSPSARLGKGVAIMAGAVINADAEIADLVVVNSAASVDHDCVLGRAVHIAPGTALCGSVTVGDRAFVAAGSVVIPGIRIGHDATIGAGSTVIRDIPHSVTAFGVPARPVKRNHQ